MFFKIIDAYLHAIQLSSSHILNFHTIAKILNHAGDFNYLNDKPIHDFFFLLGPHLINTNHWTAIIINIPSKEFTFIDPFGASTDVVNEMFNKWLNYYHRRHDAQHSNWKIRKFEHPIQKDSWNCGIYVCKFIEEVVSLGSITPTTTDEITNFRFSIAQQLLKWIIYWS